MRSVIEGRDNDVLAALFGFYARPPGKVVDLTCNSRKMWKGLDTAGVTFCDIDPAVNPDIVCDFAATPFADGEVCEEAEECWRAVKAGLLRGISVGFLAHSSRWETEGDVERFVLDDLELLELSVCAVPSNPDTLAQRSALTTLRAQALAHAIPVAPASSPSRTRNNSRRLCYKHSNESNPCFRIKRSS
jgi:hypothetical protein